MSTKVGKLDELSNILRQKDKDRGEGPLLFKTIQYGAAIKAFFNIKKARLPVNRDAGSDDFEPYGRI
ncbi:hypothetical protein PSM36_0647 [Proteiniphilum saccharofermentans]|uniref:Uncharacterized protein n=1 Tax=Proteiniphilum saccharofermentans TaxID=1642647 RepID=A0A1R3T4K0_9BACT|nr:hypothetical protein PSM36_0647 [Proteiniphilum saccharofermentans]